MLHHMGEFRHLVHYGIDIGFEMVFGIIAFQSFSYGTNNHLNFIMTQFLIWVDWMIRCC